LKILNFALIALTLLGTCTAYAQPRSAPQESAKTELVTPKIPTRVDTAYVPVDKVEKLFDRQVQFYDLILKIVIGFFSFVLTSIVVLIAIAGFWGYRDRKAMREEFEKDKERIVNDAKDTLNETVKKAKKEITLEVQRVQSYSRDAMKIMEPNMTWTLPPEVKDDIVKAFSEGAGLYHTGSTNSAIEKLTEGVVFKSDSQDKYYNLGILYDEKQEYEKAEEAFRKSIEYKPDDPEARFFFGRYLWRLGKYERAEDEFKEALKRRPDYLEAYLSLGYCLNEQGKKKEARIIFIDALDHVIKEDERKQIIDYLQRGADDDERPLYLATFPYGVLSPARFIDMTSDSVGFVSPKRGKLGAGRKRDSRGKPIPIDEQFVPLESNICRKLATFLENHGQTKEARIYWERQLEEEKDPDERDKIMRRLAKQE
jgi:tetratricopeptide (TPR) repeat protein